MSEITGHDEAIDKAVCTLLETASGAEAQMESAIRAYIEARGLVLVPKEATTAMIAAACDVWGVRVDEDVKRNITEEIKVALAAAPDPFKEEVA